MSHFHLIEATLNAAKTLHLTPHLLKSITESNKRKGTHKK